MTKSPLVPTPIIDRNGKHTTVHRRAAAAAGSAPVPPPKAPVPEAERYTEEFWLPAWAAAWIAEGAPGRAFPTERGAAVITDDEMFAYLRFGVELQVGAAMHATHPEPSYWEHSTAAASIIEHRAGPSRRVRPVAASVDLMREEGHKPDTVENMIRNGLADEHLRGVLTPEETAEVFMLISCVPTALEEASEVAALARCLTDGTIPYTLVGENPFPRRALIDLACLAEASKADEDEGGDGSSFAAAARRDPGLWLTMARLMGDAFSFVPAEAAWSAVREFGMDDCRRFGLKRLLATTDTGGSVGEAIREARGHGMSGDAIEDVLRAHRDRAEVLLAVARGEIAPATADGWL